ncbi:MAG: hypothetical protein GX362_03680 [Methanosarcinaceae archaeon]|nr:hypothetical protein [Methanosarcinaceae archaeon]
MFLAISREPETAFESLDLRVYPFKSNCSAFVSENSSSFKFKKQPISFAKSETNSEPEMEGISIPAQSPTSYAKRIESPYSVKPIFSHNSRGG